MFKAKNTLIAVTAAMFVAACGGGGDDNNNNTGGTGTDQNKNAGTTITDKPLSGPSFTMSQVVINGDRPNDYPLFENNVGIYGQARGTHAPMKSFGLALLPVLPENLPTTGLSGNGHIGIEMTDTATGSKQQLQLGIDQVNYAVSASRAWTASVPQTAKVYIHVTDKTGATANVVVDNPPANLVTLPDHIAGSESKVLTVDLDKAIELAKQKSAGDTAKLAVLNKLGAAGEFTGTFNMNVTYSALDIRKPGATTAAAGADITVTGSGQPAIKGAGLKGKYSVEVIPPGAE